MESFTAYLTLQVLWKTSGNTGFFFFPCLDRLKPFVSAPSQKEMWSSGFYGHWAVHNHRTDFSGCKASPPARRYHHYQMSLAQSRCTEHAVLRAQHRDKASKCSHCCPKSGLKPPRSITWQAECQKWAQAQRFCFFLLCRLDAQTYHTSACCALGLRAFKLHSL